MNYQEIFNVLKKNSAAMLTPQAQTAAMQSFQAPPAGMPQGGPPPGMGPAAAPPLPGPIPPDMGPAMAPPPGAVPPDMGAPVGAPVSPQAGLPPDYMGAPAGAEPAGGQGAPPPSGWQNDPMFLDFLASIGVQVDPASGTPIGPDGQPIPPQAMDQIYAQFQQAMQTQGAPPKAGAGPAMESNMSTSPENPVPQQDMMDQLGGMVQDIVDASLDKKLATLDKKISAFADKLDVIKSILDDVLTDKEKSPELNEEKALNAELEKDLNSASQAPAPEIIPTETLLSNEPKNYPDLLNLMRGPQNA